MKPFDKWNEDKKNINNIENGILFNEREIWFASLGINIGFEQDGKGERFIRPVLIIKKFNNRLCWIIPLTHSQKENHYFHTFQRDHSSKAVLSQLRLIDVKRLNYKVYKITQREMDIIKQNIRALLL